MTQMTAQLTSKLADDVYAISKVASIQVAINELNRKYPNLLTFADTNFLNARTGGPAGIKISSAFGFVLIGKVT